MKKLIGIIAGLKMGVSSIVMGAGLEVVDGGGYLVGVDRFSQQEIRLVRKGEFHYNPSTGGFENEEVRLLAWSSESVIQRDSSLKLQTKQVCLPTTEIEFSGNLSSGSETPIGGTFTKIQRIFDNLGMTHNLVFTFTRLPAGTDSDNQVQYSTEITVDRGIVRRSDDLGSVFDFTEAPMIITFNNCGLLNLFDYGQPTESNTSPKLYIEWTDTSINSAPLEIGFNLGKGKGASPTAWRGAQEPLAEGNLTAYDGNSLITYSKQDGGDTLSKFFYEKKPFQFSWLETASGLSSHLPKISQTNVRATTEIEFSGNLSSGSGTPVGGSFTKTQRIFDSLGAPHNVVFTFTKLPEGIDSDNQIQYSTEVTIDGGVVKRTDAYGDEINSTGTSMIISFNQAGQLNLVDYGQLTESNMSPKLYIEWTEVGVNSAPLAIDLKWGAGQGASPTIWTGVPELFPEGNLTAYDGNSLIAHSQQNGLGMGRYKRVDVSDVGQVKAHYSSGFCTDVGSLVFATVSNPDGLRKMGEAYGITESSGLPTIAMGGQLGWGKVKFKAIKQKRI